MSFCPPQALQETEHGLWVDKEETDFTARITARPYTSKINRPKCEHNFRTSKYTMCMEPVGPPTLSQPLAVLSGHNLRLFT
jgi:hypothetical protein